CPARTASAPLQQRAVVDVYVSRTCLTSVLRSLPIASGSRECHTRVPLERLEPFGKLLLVGDQELIEPGLYTFAMPIECSTSLRVGFCENLREDELLTHGR